jgi:hypothetical protein
MFESSFLKKAAVRISYRKGKREAALRIHSARRLSCALFIQFPR